MGKIAKALEKFSQERKASRLPKLTREDLDVLLNYNCDTGHLLKYDSDTGQVTSRSMEAVRTRGTIQRLLENKLIFPSGKLTAKGLREAHKLQTAMQSFDPDLSRIGENNGDQLGSAKSEVLEESELHPVPKLAAEEPQPLPQSEAKSFSDVKLVERTEQSQGKRTQKTEDSLLDQSRQAVLPQERELPDSLHREYLIDPKPEMKGKTSIIPITSKTPKADKQSKTDEKKEEIIDQEPGLGVKTEDRKPGEGRQATSMPGISIDDRNVDSNLVALLKPQSYEAEQFKILRTQVLFPISGNAPRSILVTSSMSGEGKSFVAANLAVSIALNVNQHVLLIDCDLRKPEVHRIFGFSELPGLSSYLMEKEELGSLIVRTSVDKLNLLPGGPEPPNPSELMCTERMSDLIKEVKARYQDRLIIIDSPPPPLAAETPFLARQVDSVLLVVKHGKTSRRQVEDLMETVGAEKIAGVVVNQVDAQLSGYSGYKKYYKNGKSYYK